MRLRDTLLWAPRPSARLGVISVASALIAVIAFLHTALGLTYEFYVFFTPR